MIDKERLLKMVDHLEQLWLENQALLKIRDNTPALPIFRVREALQHHIGDPANQALARRMFAPVRELIQGQYQAGQVLEALLEALQKIERVSR